MLLMLIRQRQHPDAEFCFTRCCRAAPRFQLDDMMLPVSSLLFLRSLAAAMPRVIDAMFTRCASAERLGVYMTSTNWSIDATLTPAPFMRHAPRYAAFVARCL